MKIAIDFDNTIVNYSELFHKAAMLENVQVDQNLSKNEIKEYIKSSNNHEWPKKWIDIQGRCYGELIQETSKDEYFLKLYNYLKQQGFEIEVTSHKSKRSLCGRYDLRESALKKIKSLGIKDEEVRFFDTQEQKCEYLGENEFDIIIDDLEEVLDKSKNNRLKILFGSFSDIHFSLKSWSLVYDFFTCLEHINFRPVKYRCLGKSSYLLKSLDKELFFKFFHEHERSFRERKSFELNLRESTSMIYQNDSLLVEEFLNFESIRIFDEWFCHEYSECFLNLQKNISKVDFKSTHGITNEMDYRRNINQRINDLRGIIDSSLLERIESLFEGINKKISFNDEAIPQYVCHPDFFRHNFGKCEGKLILFDFESFGLDDLARTFLNAVHHLGNTLESEEVLNLIDLFGSLSADDLKFWDRVVKFYDIIALEWVLISAKNPQNLTKSKSLVTIMEKNRDLGLNYWSWNKPVVDSINERI